MAPDEPGEHFRAAAREALSAGMSAQDILDTLKAAEFQDLLHGRFDRLEDAMRRLHRKAKRKRAA